MGEAWLVAGLLPLGLGGYLAARFGFRAGPGSPRTLATATLVWGWLTLGAEALGVAGRLDRPALVAWSVAGLAAGAAVAWLARRGGAEIELLTPTPDRPGAPSALALGLVAWVFLRLGVVSFVQPVKVVSDGPIYHLYFAARWWKAGRLFLVATPFGESGAPYFWGNGELWYAWLMTLYGGDRYAKVGQVPFLALAGLAVAATSRLLGAGAGAARIAAAWFVTLGPMLIFGFEPNVDAILVAGYAVAAYFFALAGTEPGPIRARLLILGSLAAGLGMGTKPTGIVFFPPLLLAMAGYVALRERRNGRRWIGPVLATLLPAGLMMGFWPARNFLLTGNPLYPLHVEAFGRTWLAGWFGPGAMTRSPFYIPRDDWRAAVDLVLQVADPRLLPAWLAAAAGLWAVGRSRRGGPGDGDSPRSAADRWTWAAAALGLFDLAAYWWLIPYRTQQRFMLPGLALLAIPLARLFGRAAWLRAAGAGLLLLHLVTPEAWPFADSEAKIPWDLDPRTPNAVPAPIAIPLSTETLLATWGRPLWATLVLAAGVAMAAAAAGLLSRARRRWVRPSAGLAALAPFVLVAAWCLGGFASIPFPIFRDYNEGWAVLDYLAGPGGARVAYAGNKIPYYLMGSRLQNEVRYVNVDAHRDWLMHDYHRNAPNVGLPTTWPDPFPGWDRLRPDYDAWLANLRAERIDFLVVTRVVPEEGQHNVADAAKFPIERVWAEAHPESFEPAFGVPERGDRMKIFRVRPPREISAAGTDGAARSH